MSGNRNVFILFSVLLFCTYLAEQAVGVSPLVHEVDHVADVDADAAAEVLVKPDVAGQ